MMKKIYELFNAVFLLLLLNACSRKDIPGIQESCYLKESNVNGTKSIYEYSDKGLVLKSTHISKADDAEKKSIINYQYDDKNKIIKAVSKIYYNGKAKYTVCYKFVWTKNILQKVIQTDQNSKPTGLSHHCTFNDDGKLIEITSETKTSLLLAARFEYDEKGVVSFISYTSPPNNYDYVERSIYNYNVVKGPEYEMQNRGLPFDLYAQSFWLEYLPIKNYKTERYAAITGKMPEKESEYNITNITTNDKGYVTSYILNLGEEQQFNTFTYINHY